MTPKEKAFSLVAISNANNYVAPRDKKAFNLAVVISKDLAKACVAEIIAESEQYDFGVGKRKEFWQEVLVEIDKL